MRVVAGGVRGGIGVTYKVDIEFFGVLRCMKVFNALMRAVNHTKGGLI